MTYMYNEQAYKLFIVSALQMIAPNLISIYLAFKSSFSYWYGTYIYLEIFLFLDLSTPTQPNNFIDKSKALVKLEISRKMQLYMIL